MTLRTTFDNLSDSVNAHRTDHLALHRAYNFAAFADDYDSVQAALDAASSSGRRRVYLNPVSTYDINTTLIIPTTVTLEGGGATLRASGPMEYMVRLNGNRAALQGVTLNGNNQAVSGLQLDSVHFCRIEDNGFLLFNDPTGAAIRAGGALYSTITRNAIYNIAGFGLDALNAYSSSESYYGINHGVSQQNIWGARMGGIRLEGMLTSIADDFEVSLDGKAAVEVGPIQTWLHLYSPYFEMRRGKAEKLVAVHIKGSARASITNGQLFGDGGDGSIAVNCNVAYGVAAQGCLFSRWDVAFGGSVAFNMPVMIGGNYFGVVNTPNALNTNIANVSLLHV